MTQLSALSITIAIEVPVALLVAALLGVRDRRGLARVGLVVAAASLVTHPVAWWASVEGLHAVPWRERAAIIELGVALVETAIVAWGTALSPGRALVVAGAANLASFGFGLWLLS